MKPGQCEFCGTSQFKLIGQSPSKFVTPDSGELSSSLGSGGSSDRSSSLSKGNTRDSSFFLSRISSSPKENYSPPLSPSLPLYSSPTTVSATRPRNSDRPSRQKVQVSLAPKWLLGLLCGAIALGGYYFWQSRYDTSEFNKIVLTENFTSPKSWVLTADASIQNGGLYQRQSRRNHYGASIWMGKRFQDVDFSADATKTSGPNDIPYGLITRVNGKDGQRFYYLFINGQGNFVLGKHAPDHWWHRIGWQKNDAIRGSGRRNRLRIVIKDNLVIGFINGQKVGSFQDDEYEAGRVAVFSMRGRGARVGVYFDNVLIKERIPKEKDGK
jgi:hypothetical protein